MNFHISKTKVIEIKQRKNEIFFNYKIYLFFKIIDFNLFFLIPNKFFYLVKNSISDKKSYLDFRSD